MDSTCQIQKPATSSFVAANGPSITVRVSPEKCTRLPFELGCSPSPASMIPALTSCSLKAPISVSSASLGMMPASLSAVALTMTSTRMLFSMWKSGRADGAE